MDCSLIVSITARTLPIAYSYKHLQNTSHCIGVVRLERNVRKGHHDKIIVQVIDTNMLSPQLQVIFILYFQLIACSSTKNLYDEYNDKLELLSDYETRHQESSIKIIRPPSHVKQKCSS